MKTVNTGYMIRAPCLGTQTRQEAAQTIQLNTAAKQHQRNAGTAAYQTQAAFFIPKINNQNFL